MSKHIENLHTFFNVANMEKIYHDGLPIIVKSDDGTKSQLIDHNILGARGTVLRDKRNGFLDVALSVECEYILCSIKSEWVDVDIDKLSVVSVSHLHCLISSSIRNGILLRLQNIQKIHITQFCIQNMNALQYACKCGQLHIVTWLVEEMRFDIEKANDLSHRAIFYANTEIMEYLVRMGSKILCILCARYDTRSKFPCGHSCNTICEKCIFKVKKCPTCLSVIVVPRAVELNAIDPGDLTSIYGRRGNRILLYKNYRFSLQRITKDQSRTVYQCTGTKNRSDKKKCLARIVRIIQKDKTLFRWGDIEHDHAPKITDVLKNQTESKE